MKLGFCQKFVITFIIYFLSMQILNSGIYEIASNKKHSSYKLYKLQFMCTRLIYFYDGKNIFLKVKPSNLFFNKKHDLLVFFKNMYIICLDLQCKLIHVRKWSTGIGAMYYHLYFVKLIVHQVKTRALNFLCVFQEFHRV